MTHPCWRNPFSLQRAALAGWRCGDWAGWWCWSSVLCCTCRSCRWPPPTGSGWRFRQQTLLEQGQKNSTTCILFLPSHWFVCFYGKAEHFSLPELVFKVTFREFRRNFFVSCKRLTQKFRERLKYTVLRDVLLTFMTRRQYWHLEHTFLCGKKSFFKRENKIITF